MTRRQRFVAAGLLASVVAAGCGKKGPPLPPLVRLPAPPKDFAALRRGKTVDVQFVVPAANVDGTTPADVVRVDVYAMTGLSTLTPDEIIKHGGKVSSVVVNPPADPDASEEEAAKAAKAKPPNGLEQGAVVRLKDSIDLTRNADETDVRSYLAVGVNRRGRRGALAPRVLVPLVPSPPAPGQPEVTWDETEITVTWPAPEDREDVPVAYHVYAPGEVEARLTKDPVDENWFIDQRIEWGAERCYVVRTLEMAEGLSLESDASPAACVTLTDTFPPAAPLNLTVIAGTGAMDLIWDPSPEADAVGYIVLRAIGPDAEPQSITPMPLEAPTFKDVVPAGAQVTYAVEAVDKAGNVSPPSDPVVEIAR